MAVSLIVMLVACAGVRPEAAIADRMECGALEVAAGSVPDAFEPVAVYRCDTMAEVTTPEGPGPGVISERLEGDLQPLLGALAEADDPRWPGPCTAIGVIVPELWFVDAEGRAVHASFPADGCGLPKMTAVQYALDQLMVVDRSELPGELLQ